MTKALRALGSLMILVGVLLPGMAWSVDKQVVVIAGEGPEVDEALDGFREELAIRMPEASVVDDGAADLVLAMGDGTVMEALGRADAPVLAGTVNRSNRLDALAVPAVIVDVPAAQQVQLVRRFLPRTRTIGVVYADPGNAARVQALADAAAHYEIQVVARQIQGPGGLPAALQGLARKVDVLVGLPDEVVFSSTTAKPLLLFSFRNRIPLVGPNEAWVEAGALYAPTVDYRDIGAQCAEVAAELLAGRPTQRITAPRQVGWKVNERSARQLGVRLSAELIEGSR